MSKLSYEYLENMKREGKSENTINSYKYDFKKFENWLINKGLNLDEDITRISFRILNEYKLYLLEALEPVTTNRNLHMLRGFFEYLVDMEIIVGNPMARVKDCKVQKKQRIIPTKEEANNMKEVLKVNKDYSRNSEFLNMRNKLIINMLLGTGMRNSELRGLKLSDIDNNGNVNILGKGNKVRYSKLGETLFKEYKAYLKIREEVLIKSEIDIDYVFISYRGKQLNKQTLIDIVKDIAKETGIDKNITPHALRHNFATDLLKETHDIKLVATALGHADIGTTQIYLHQSNEELEEALEKHQTK